MQVALSGALTGVPSLGPNQQNLKIRSTSPSLPFPIYQINPKCLINVHQRPKVQSKFGHSCLLPNSQLKRIRMKRRMWLWRVRETVVWFASWYCA
ncbi:transcription factor C subunit 6 [Cryptococcus neoformans]|nr:transcription factor C subunit 6 [Cryptococcus neoformans var. grubii]